MSARKRFSNFQYSFETRLQLIWLVLDTLIAIRKLINILLKQHLAFFDQWESMKPSSE